MVDDHGHVHVATVFLTDGAQQVERPRPCRAVEAFEHGDDTGVVAARIHKDIGKRVARQPETSGSGDAGLSRGERRGVGVAYRILAGETAVVLLPHLLGDKGCGRIFRRGNDIELGRSVRSRRRSECHRDRADRVGRGLRETEPAAVGGPDHHVSPSGRHRRASVGSRLPRGHGVIFCIIVDAETDIGPGRRGAVGVEDDSLHLTHRRIVGRYVDARGVGCLHQHLLGSVIVAEHVCVHHHAARRRGIEPCEVEHRLRFAGTDEMPLAVGPYLDPRMVVVGVGPAGRIYLTGRYADRA